MEGEEYYVYNPDIFDDNYWTYKELQKLCLKLNINHKGTRNNLEKRLKKWHKERKIEINENKNNDNNENNNENNDYFEENYIMNVNGNNFSLLKIEIKQQQQEEQEEQQEEEQEDAKKKKENSSQKKKRKLNLSDNMNNNEVISFDPSFINPIQSYNDCITPRKGILKRSKTFESSLNDNNQFDNYDNQSFKSNKLQFSPFNGVKIISNRYSIHSPSSYPSI